MCKPLLQTLFKLTSAIHPLLLPLLPSAERLKLLWLLRLSVDFLAERSRVANTPVFSFFDLVDSASEAFEATLLIIQAD